MKRFASGLFALLFVFGPFGAAGAQAEPAPDAPGESASGSWAPGPETAAPEGTPQASGGWADWLFPEDSPGTRGAVYRYLRRPSDLTLTFGLAYLSYFSLIGNWYDTDEADQVADPVRQIAHRADGLGAWRLGFQVGRSYLDLRLSPRWGGTRDLVRIDDWNDPPTEIVLATYEPNQAFVLEARTGYRYDTAAEEDGLELSLEFYGTYLTLQEPLTLGTVTHNQALSFGAGTGFVQIGLGFPVSWGFAIPLEDLSPWTRALELRAGLLPRLGVLVPFELAGELQVNAQAVLWFSESLSLVADVQPLKFQWGAFGHGFNHLELALRQRW